MMEDKSMKEKILGPKKARGLIIAGVLFCIMVFITYLSVLPTISGYSHAIIAGIYMALIYTFISAVKETFDIRENAKIALIVIVIGLSIFYFFYWLPESEKLSKADMLLDAKYIAYQTPEEKAWLEEKFGEEREPNYLLRALMINLYLISLIFVYWVLLKIIHRNAKKYGRN